MPPPITAQVATVRQSTSLLAKSQMANRQATTAIKMQALVVQKAILVMTRGLRKPRFIGIGQLSRRGSDYQISANRTVFSHRGQSQRQAARVVTYPNPNLQFVRLRVVGREG